MSRLIRNTGVEARWPWPEDVHLQGGEQGMVLSASASNYRTAFVEAFPGGTFLRGEGTTVEEAEDACWAEYLRWVNCDGEPGAEGTHGDYDRRNYRNGGAFCGRCGVWVGRVLEPLPPNGEESGLLGQALGGDLDALREILEVTADPGALPTREERQ